MKKLLFFILATCMSIPTLAREFDQAKSYELTIIYQRVDTSYTEFDVFGGYTSMAECGADGQSKTYRMESSTEYHSAEYYCKERP